ncbi:MULTISPECIES: response regulator transcription factor [unclassified Oceanispirochaeta]|uniref:response regulator transcription factor n=1 Tax=unclassified Oceanispirochaeta TaxID=2635722 RepID=UPI000E091D06|nr:MULTISPECIES: response regulator transcription factor [unclassified Oceanispirochaeta]MBF9016828.1 response regulator transcription factor [Oceanispirochaeta sp. M2]NPD73191.1 response regulator transcription factor [Oceanispirochaeta sp. M1]RDG31059.1 DNA-binding response regulator [Oceanispirochaeta sp. M1]
MTEKQKILIVDDEDHILQMLRMNMKKQGFDSFCVESGEEALSICESEKPDLILLDVMLPGIDGVETCRRLKNHPDSRSIPVIMLSARSQGQDKINGLMGGADDYITKPFSLEELFLRIRAALRQVALLREEKAVEFRCGSLVLNAERYQVISDDSKIDFTLTEFRILHLMMKSTDRTVSREILCRDIFEKDPGEIGRTMDVHFRNIRKKLTDNMVKDCEILTLRGEGFRMTGPA